MSVFGRRAAAAIAVATALLAVPAAATSDSEAAGILIGVGTDAMVYRDGFSTGTFEIDGACVTGDHDVVVEHSECDPTQPGRGIARGVVRTAMLGFHARRSVEVVAGAPANQLPVASTDEPLHVVGVTVQRPGSMTVRLSGVPTDEVDPQPVPGSASPGGEVAGRSVEWNLGNVEPGGYVFSARFQRTTGFVGTYVPQASVELTEQTDTLVEYSSGSLPAGGAAVRISTLTMEQRVAPLYGPPEVLLSDLTSVASRDVPDAFGITGTLHTRGAYQATASGLVTAVEDLPLSQIAPGAEGVVNAAFVVSEWMAPNGAQKALAITGLQTETEPEFTVTGLRMGMQTASPLVSWIWGPLAGTLYEGESQRIGVVGHIATVKADRQGHPQEAGGAIRMDWSGGWTRGTSDMVAAQTPVTELGNTGRELWGATVPVVVRGGDIDNRTGDAHVLGEPLVIEPGDHRSLRTVLGGFIFVPETQFDLHPEWTARGVALVPRVGPGGYWLESSRDGYDRDWANVLMIVPTLEERDEDDRPGAGQLESVLHVPTGAAGGVVLLDVRRRTARSLTLAPGTWHVRATSDALLAEPTGVP